MFSLLALLGMGVVTVSSSAARTPLGLSTNFSANRSTLKRPVIVAFKGDKPNNTALVSPQEPVSFAIEAPKGQRKRTGRGRKPSRKVKADFSGGECPSTLELDYNEAAAKLESIFKLSPASDSSDVEYDDGTRTGRRRKKTDKDNVVRNHNKKPKRLDLEKRIALRKYKEVKVVASKRKDTVKCENEKIENLLREYSSSTDLVSLDWKKMKIPPVLPSSEHVWLFKLMQPMKVSIPADYMKI